MCQGLASAWRTLGVQYSFDAIQQGTRSSSRQNIRGPTNHPTYLETMEHSNVDLRDGPVFPE